MLQFIVKATPRFSVEELVHKALIGGCRWIQIDSSGEMNSLDAMQQTVEAVVPMCRDHEAFLVLENDLTLVEDMKVHGALLTVANRTEVAAARERLGAEAVLGVRVHSMNEIVALRGLDVDYVLVELPDDVTDAGEFYTQLINHIRPLGIDFHVVAEGSRINPDMFEGMLAAGVAGVAVTDQIADAPSPEAATQKLVGELDAARALANSRVNC